MQRRLDWTVVKRELSRLVDWVAKGNVVIILRNGVALAQLEPLVGPVRTKRPTQRKTKKWRLNLDL